MKTLESTQLVSISGAAGVTTPLSVAAHIVRGNLVNTERALKLQKWASDMGTAYWKQALHPSEAQLHDQRNAVELAQKTYWGTLEWLVKPYFR